MNSKKQFEKNAENFAERMAERLTKEFFGRSHAKEEESDLKPDDYVEMEIEPGKTVRIIKDCFIVFSCKESDDGCINQCGSFKVGKEQYDNIVKVIVHLMRKHLEYRMVILGAVKEFHS